MDEFLQGVSLWKVKKNLKVPLGINHFSQSRCAEIANEAYQASTRRDLKTGIINAGIPLHKNGFVVYDLDVIDKKNKEFDENLFFRAKKLLNSDKPLAIVRTASGGYHVFLKSTDHLQAPKKLKALLGKGTCGVDLLCGKCHVVCAGSTIDGQQYLPLTTNEDPR